MRILTMVTMTVGLALMTVPVVLPRLGGIAGVMQAVGLQPAARPRAAPAPGGGTVSAALAMFAGAVKALGGTGDGDRMVALPDAGGAAPDPSGQFGVACKIMASQGMMSEAACLAQMGALARPGGMQTVFDDVSRALEGPGGGTAGIAAPAPAPKGIAPRVPARSDGGTSKGGAKFVKVNK